MSEVNELPQMCFLHEASTSMQTLMTGIYSLKENADLLERWLVSKDKG